MKLPNEIDVMNQTILDVCATLVDQKCSISAKRLENDWKNVLDSIKRFKIVVKDGKLEIEP
jgi:hypothetical protein